MNTLVFLKANKSENCILLGFRDPLPLLPFVPANIKFTLTTNNRNTLNILDEFGFKYNRDSKVTNSRGEDRWTCVRRKKGCKVVVKTNGGGLIIAQKSEHTCELDLEIQ